MPLDPVRGGPFLRAFKTGNWLTPGDLGAAPVILIHGFTASGAYFTDLASFLEGFGFTAILFEYDSYVGVDQASLSLSQMLGMFETHLKNGFCLIGHSMGGLVARHFVQMTSTATLHSLIRGLCTLGTPHAGTLTSLESASAMLNKMVQWAESIDRLHPFARSPFCRSAQQLVLLDEGRLIESLNFQRQAQLQSIPLLTISGGKRGLEFGGNPLNSAAMSAGVQRLLGDCDNDGLVPERSSNVGPLLRETHSRHIHLNRYFGWRETNHTNLVRNMTVASEVIRWLREQVFAPQFITQ